MTTASSLIRVLIAVALGTAVLSACVVAPQPRREVVYRSYPVYTQAQPADVVAVDMAPPPPVVEVIPVAPFVGAIWVHGYWGWSGGRHVWTGGHYVHPIAGHRFVPHRWEPVGGRWVLRGGFWIR